MYSCVHLSIKEHQFYKSIELYPWYITLEKVLNKFERIWNEHIWTSSEQVWTHFNTFVQNLFKWVQMCSNGFKTRSNVSNVFQPVQNLLKCVQNCSKIIRVCSARGPTWQAELDLVLWRNGAKLTDMCAVVVSTLCWSWHEESETACFSCQWNFNGAVTANDQQHLQLCNKALQFWRGQLIIICFNGANQHFLTAKLELSILCTKVSPCGCISSHNENRQPKLPLLLSSLKQERPKPALFRMLSCGGEWGAEEGNCRRSDVRRSFLGRRSNVSRRTKTMVAASQQ